MYPCLSYKCFPSSSYNLEKKNYHFEKLSEKSFLFFFPTEKISELKKRKKYLKKNILLGRLQSSLEYFLKKIQI